ncbi:MAG: toprim domain-containing protein [Pyrinomonadaceae bacterium]
MREYDDSATRMLLCPLCGGGRSKEAKLSVTGDRDGYVWYCFRASCGFKGKAGKHVEPVKRTFEPRVFEQPTRWADDWEARNLHNMAHCRMAIEGGMRVLEAEPSTAVWVCRHLNGSICGVTTRTADKKIRTYRLTENFYHSIGGKEKGLWIVEDPKSAAKLACYTKVTVVVLLGTHMGGETEDDIVRWARTYKNPIYVALDPGAEAEAAKIVQRLVNRGAEVSFVPLQKDIKDLDCGAIKELVSGR